jgi:hypothetical protein
MTHETGLIVAAEKDLDRKLRVTRFRRRQAFETFSRENQRFATR